MDRIDTISAFLTELGEALERKEGVDLDLADILKTHILKFGASNDGVDLAKEAMLKLAAKRAVAKE